MTSFTLSLGTETYRVSPGLASEGLNVIRLTVRSAGIACSVFSRCEGSRLGGTAMVYMVFINVLYTPNMSDLDPIPEDTTPLIPGKGGNDDDDDKWDDVDLSASQFQRKTGNSGSFPLTPLIPRAAKPYQ